jgi:hypothetical protein
MTGQVLKGIGFVLFLVYVIAGFAAFQQLDGYRRYLGYVSPFSGLLLPFIGKGTVGGVQVHTFLWWALFVSSIALMGIGFALTGEGVD